MNTLKKKLDELLKQGYEEISILQVLTWMKNIQANAKIKRLGLDK